MPLPALAPMLATAGALPPDDGRWAFEVKWDGARVLCAVQAGRLRLTTRGGNDVTSHYPELAGIAAAPGAPEMLLDGEVVAFDAAGRPDFGLLQSRLHVVSPEARLRRRVPVTLVAFDVLHLHGRPLLADTYDSRREALASLGLEGEHWQAPGSFQGDGADVLAATKSQGMEGVVAKRRDSTYRPGLRSDCWVKVKHVRRQSAVVCGWRPGEGGRSGRLGSLLLGVQGQDGLDYAGHVGSGFSSAALQRLETLLAPLVRGTAPYASVVPREHARHAVWTEAVLVCEVAFTGWTREGRLRHPSWQGLRDDLDPADVVREEAP